MVAQRSVKRKRNFPSMKEILTSQRLATSSETVTCPNDKGSQSSKMHSKVVSFSLLVLSPFHPCVYLRVFEAIIDGSFPFPVYTLPVSATYIFTNY